MTQTRYFLWRIAQTFGIAMRQRHATNAASEMHLLREAEEILGRLAWEDAEQIEELSVEYWSLRKLSKQYGELTGRIDSASVHLQNSHHQRNELMGAVADSTKDLVAERVKLVETNERLASRRENILAEARAVKRRHSGIKAKLEVLVGEGSLSTPEVDESKKELLGLKKQFKDLREQRDEVAARISAGETELKELEAKIENRRSEMRDEALGNYQNIGKANRDISNNRAELGSLENEMITLFSEIGRYILAHRRDSAVSPVAAKHRSLTNQMTALRVSINLNNKLSGRTTAAPVSKG